jgi:signal transduction histidine kinase
MIKQWFNWKNSFVIIAILIVTGTIAYSKYLAGKIKENEKIKIAQWVEAIKLYSNPTNTETILTAKILTENSNDIPIILVTENDSLLDFRNIDTALILNNQHLKLIASYKAINPVIEWKNPVDSTQINKVYFGESTLLQEVRYYPIIQLIIAALFVIILVITQYNQYKSSQNQVWAGLAKETAHQLGTPVSSLQGWLEVMKDIAGNEKILPELQKDVNRLQLISDRFGKIGSKPTLEEKNIVEHIEQMLEYMKKRAGAKVNFTFSSTEKDIPAMICPPLFDWVIENLIKNALDAMDGKGEINIQIKEDATHIFIDVKDNGKGITKENITKVFKPGFTTKKRGWGLGLTLTKRIIEEYHSGRIFIKESEINKGTTFAIVLNK